MKTLCIVIVVDGLIILGIYIGKLLRKKPQVPYENISYEFDRRSI